MCDRHNEISGQRRSAFAMALWHSKFGGSQSAKSIGITARNPPKPSENLPVLKTSGRLNPNC